MKPRLIGIYSSTPGCGKSTMASYLAAAHGYLPVRFAGPLKDMLAPLLECFMSRRDVMAALDGAEKERPIDALDGLTTRRLMQTLGTEWGRMQVHPELWTRAARATIEQNLRAGRFVVVDDVRFHNEYELLRELGACMVMLCRPGRTVGAPETYGHSSEGQLGGRSWDYVLIPAEGVPAVHQAASELMARLESGR